MEVAQTGAMYKHQPQQHQQQTPKQGVDLKPLLIPASALNEKAGVIKSMDQDHLLEQALDNELIKQVGTQDVWMDG